MIWAPISWYSIGPVITLNGRITASDYVDISRNQVHPLVQMFPNDEVIFQDNSPTQTARSVQTWYNMMHFNIFTGQHNRQTYTIKIPWSVLESMVRSRFHLPSSLKQLQDVFHEEWYNVPLQTIQNLYVSIPRRIQAVLQPNSGPTLY
jgi:hypothetical protein